MKSSIIDILITTNSETTDYKNEDIEHIISSSFESPLKVIIAGLCIKIYDPSCDTRYHQKANGGKYCLRSIEQHTTQWCALQNYFSTNCVGSLSNALRHKEPYTKEYSRVWKSEKCKNAFLNCFHQMNNNNEQFCKYMLVYTLQLLKSKTKSHADLYNEPVASNTIELYPLIYNLCNLSFNKSSIIPVIIVHTYYQIINHEGLVSLKHHNSPDIKGKSYGDIEIWRKNSPETVIEIKHGLEIKESYFQTFAIKVKNMNTKNYILTSLPYQRYDYNSKFNVVSWNVASFVHYNLYNTQYVNEYILLLYKNLMKSNIDLTHKENLKNFFQCLN